MQRSLPSLIPSWRLKLARRATLSRSHRLLHVSPAACFPLEAPRDEYDVVLMPGLDGKWLREEIGPQIGVEYLAPVVPPTIDNADRRKGWPLKGKCLQMSYRMMALSAPVQLRDRCVNVIFVVDTASPNTYLAKEALFALGVKKEDMPQDRVAYEFGVRINGVQHYVSSTPDDSHFAGVSLLGLDFLERIAATIKMSRESREFTVEMGEDATPDALR